MSHRANHAMASLGAVLILTLLVCGGYGFYTSWQAQQAAKEAAEVLQQERDATYATLWAAADFLDGQLTESGYYDRTAVGDLLGGQKVLPDAWGNPIAIGYSDVSSVEFLTVTSAGPDGLFLTADDLHVRKRNLVAGEVGEATGEGIRGLIRGVFERPEEPEGD